jgi:hypothetical protein
MGWSTPRPGRFTPGKEPVPIVQEAGWAPERVWTCVENLASTGIQSPDRSACSKSLYWLSYSDTIKPMYHKENNKQNFCINTCIIFGVSAILAEAKEKVEHHVHNTRDAVCSVQRVKLMLKKQLIIQNIIQHSTTKWNVIIMASDIERESGWGKM